VGTIPEAPCITASTTPEVEINPLKMVRGCPCGRVIIQNVKGPTRNSLLPWNAFVNVQLHWVSPRVFSWGKLFHQQHVPSVLIIMHKHAYHVNETTTRKAGYQDSFVGGADLDAEELNNNK